LASEFHYSCNQSVGLDLDTDLDQLNLILGVLGSPSQEDLDCIINEKVCDELAEFVALQ